MLDQDTKRKIDNARDILVGKIPDPKSQVEQLTISLIYKFMDDMDMESIEMGGVASFFTGDYRKYAWSKIFDRSLSGFELTNLYSEAIIKMNQNPNIPQLFRDIFKNAYLPYRDPETLRAFLKEINGFHYDHSERLGDAFEYLLSVLGSQGDAGQFRTPRHIIDFIVKVVNPQKNQTILDPACGTAGFLISSYKNILAENTRDKRGDLLTPTERLRLMRNFAGYDISPDMVRLSLVNLYLHGFPDPIIHEYDTLTSEERWNETYDVILANPPFMTPKGGIRPHKRFSVQAKRSEVLFVDYIAEHLNPGGRAGVIVPEGIIFQSQNAYKKLRKMLVENYLYAVVSLPAGVFQPYAGVKTSILLMDKTLSKRTAKILFVKIENDGYDPGAQRRPIDKNDLPKALEYLQNYRKALLSNGSLENTDYAHIVDKSKIEASGDRNLSGERYRDAYELRISNYELVDFDNTINKVGYTRKIKKSDFLPSGKYPIIDQSEDFIAGFWNNEKDVFKIKKPVIIFGDHTRVIKYVDFDFVLGADGVKILEPNGNYEPKFYYYVLKELKLKNLGYSRHYKELKRTKIPHPPLDIQKAIVADIDGYQKIIDGARLVVDNWKPTIKIDPEWEMVELMSVCNKITDGSHYSPKTIDNGYPYITVKDMIDDRIDFDNCKYINEDEYKRLLKNDCNPQKNDVLFSKDGTVGKVSLVYYNKKFVILSSIAIIRPDMNLISPAYLKYLLKNKKILDQAIGMKTGSALRRIILVNIKKLKIPLPPLSVQQEIVARIEAEQEMINANKKLIEIFEQKIKDKIGEVWGE